VRAPLAIAAILLTPLTLAAAGCGGEPTNPERTEATPAASEGGSAGLGPVPPGAPYDIDGNSWRQLLQADQFQIAAAFVADNPGLCDGAEASSVAFGVSDAFESELPLETPIAEALAASCGASP
jgi:hypothetical protein